MKFTVHDSVVDASTHAHTPLKHFVIETNRVIINSAIEEEDNNLISLALAFIHSRGAVLPFLPYHSRSTIVIHACTRILLV